LKKSFKKIFLKSQQGLLDFGRDSEILEVGGCPKFTLKAPSGFQNAHPPFDYFSFQGFLSFFISSL
jgi:hypothetical protein